MDIEAQKDIQKVLNKSVNSGDSRRVSRDDLLCMNFVNKFERNDVEIKIYKHRAQFLAICRTPDSGIQAVKIRETFENHYPAPKYG